MESPPPSSPPLSFSSPRRSSLHDNPAPLLEQVLPLPAPSPRLRPRRRPIAASEAIDALPDATPPLGARQVKGRSAAIDALPDATPPLRARKAKGRAAATARTPRRSRRKPGVDKADGTCGDDDDLERARKRKRGKEKLVSEEKSASVPAVVSFDASPSEIAIDDRRGAPDGPFERVFELLIWKNVAKSTLWFGFGSTFFLSSCFSTESSSSITSAMSNMGLLVLGIAFIKNTIQRQQCDSRGNLQLTEDDIVRAARVILPVVNAALAKIQATFSGDPAKTLKVAPILLLGANYGHLITLWRLLVTGFFLSFTVPKFYLCYSQQIHRTAENTISWVQEAWKSCRCKRLVAASAATVFWNLFSLRMRIFTAFIFVVMLRYRRQHVGEGESGKESVEEENQQQAVISKETSSIIHLD